MKNLKDFTQLKNATAIKKAAREYVMDVVVAALNEHFGDDAIAKVGNNEFAVVVGTANDSDSCPNDVIVTLKPTVKEWETRRTANKSFEKYDLQEAAAAYKLELDEKEEKRKDREKKKKEKTERDKKAREEKKKESEDE